MDFKSYHNFYETSGGKAIHQTSIDHLKTKQYNASLVIPDSVLFCDSVEEISNLCEVYHFRTEKSTDQVIKPINIEALSKWVGFYSDDILENMAKIAPMLQTLGYDPAKSPPDYGKPDPKVADNTMHIKQNMEYWRKKEQEILVKEKVSGRSPSH